MMVLVTYDVSTESDSGKKRLRHVAKICEDYGQRVQNSVFECLVDPTQWILLRKRLLDKIKKDKDSLRIYFLGKNWKRRVEHIGNKKNIDLEEPLMI